MTYRLFRVPDPDAAPVDGVHLGEFPDFEAALDARDDDVIQILAARDDGQRMLVCHRIVGPDEYSDEQQHPVISELDSPTASADREHALDETRRWLAQIHKPS